MKKLLSVLLTIVMLVVPVAEMTAFAAPAAVTVADMAEESVPVAEFAPLPDAESKEAAEQVVVEGEASMSKPDTGSLMSEYVAIGNYRKFPAVTKEDIIKNSPVNAVEETEGDEEPEEAETVEDAEEVTYLQSEYGDYDYTVKKNSVIIEYYFGDEEYVHIPAHIGGYPVTEIASYAFSDNENLVCVTIPATVTTIASDAFLNCINLDAFIVDGYNQHFSNDDKGVLFDKKKTKLIMYPSGNESYTYLIPDSVKEIGDFAFSWCPFETIFIPENVTKIGERIFHRSASLASIDVDGGNKSYSADGNGVLFDKKQSTLIYYPPAHYGYTYKIPSSVTKISDGAFFNSFGLVYMNIPGNVKNIGQMAFQNSGIEEVILPDSVKTIEYGVFSGCENLMDVTFGTGVTAIGDAAFAFCTNLRNIVLPSKVKTIGELAFAFSSLESITIPNSVKTIEYGTFWGCYELSDINLGTGITVIGDSAFSECYKLYSIILPTKLKEIGDFAFEMTGLSNVTVPNSVKSIGYAAFADCPDLYSIDLGTGVTTLGEYVFAYSGLFDVAIPKSVKRLEEGTFYNCENIRRIYLPVSITYIGAYVLTGCSNYESFYYDGTSAKWDKVVMNDTDYYWHVWYMGYNSVSGGITWVYNDENNVLAIGGSGSIANYKTKYTPWWYYEDDVTGVIVGSGVKKIGEYSLCGLPNLRSAMICSGVTTIGECAFLNDSSLWDITIPNTVTSVGNYAFQNCEGPFALYIPASVKTIGEYAFSLCPGIEVVEISEGVTSIGDCAFWDCENLWLALIPASVKKIDGNPFAEVYPTIVCDVDTAAYEYAVSYICDYSLKTYWIDYYSSVSAKLPKRQLKTSGTPLVLDSTVPTCKGYSFVGYSFSPYGDVEYYPGDTVYEDFGENVMLYAVWEEGVYYIDYDANGGMFAPERDKKTHGKTLYLSDEIPYREGYTFMGWSTSKNGKAQYDAGDKYTADSAATLYAVWEATKYVIEYDANGGTSAPKSQLKTHDVSLKLSTSKPKMDGYDFVGWSFWSWADEADYEPGDSFTLNEDTVLFAVWKEKEIPVKKVTLSATKLSMCEDGGAFLEAIVSPANATNQEITWYSSDETIATVYEDGYIEAHRSGKVKITAVSSNGKKATCSITVGEPATKVEFSSLKSTSLAVGKTLSLKAKASRDDKVKPVSTNVVFEIVSGEEYATIDAKGKLKGIATGEVVVRATAEAGTETAFAEVVINVCIPATKVVLNIKKATVSAGEKVYLQATMSPETNTDTLFWSSSNESVAVVDDEGVVTTLKEGSVKITATSGSGKKATCTIKVEKAAVPATFSELILTDVSYEFVEDEYIIEANPGAVGGMEISATVKGPSDVKEVLIANWGTDISDMSQKEIYEEAVWYANMWKSHGFEVGNYNRIPFEIRTMHPIDEDEFDLDLQVLLIGLDKDCNAVGYYILEQN